jgi:hypothetical protein
LRVDLQNCVRAIVPTVLALAALVGPGLRSASAQTTAPFWTTSKALAHKADQNPPSQEIAVDTFQVVGAPLGISGATLTSTKQGYRLKCSASNSSNEQLLGIRYLLLSVDSTGAVRRIVDQSEDLKLDAYSATAISFRAPLTLKVDREDRVFLLVAQVIGRESIWETLKAKDALLHYAKGDSYLMPEVRRSINLVDTPGQGLRVIY